MAFDHSFGIEEEFFLVDAATGMLGTPRILWVCGKRQLKIYNDSRAAGDESLDALLKVIDWLKATTLL